LGLFFNRRTPCSRQSYAIIGPVNQVKRQLFLTTTDGFLVESCDLADKCQTSVAPSIGFNGRVPSTLLLVKTAHNHIDLMMKLFLTLVFFAPTNPALTLVY
jgi:hypothetical protein